MKRRRYLELGGALSLSALAGCSSGDDSGDSTRTTSTQQSGLDERSDIYVSPDGNADATGSESDPLGSIQHAFEHAYPGDTIHALPGEYVEAVRTRRSGEAGAPITITGPREAVFRGKRSTDKVQSGFHIEHSHIHLRGITFNGLWDTDNPDSEASYIRTLITAHHSPSSPDHYHRDLVIKPDAVGNALRPLVHVMHSENVEIGEFEVIGPAGLAMLEFGDDEKHNGEVVYVGTAPKSIPTEKNREDWMKDFYTEPDTTNDVHVHHIDNSAGHPHAELVDLKDGTHNVTVEYCTDAGGGAKYILPSNNATSGTAIHLSGRENTVRWNVIENSNGQGVEMGSWDVANKEAFEEQKGSPFPEELFDSGRANSLYGNRIVDCAGLAVQYPVTSTDDGDSRIAEDYGPDDQRHVCGNEVNGETHGDPGSECDTSLPTAETIGHTGGDSPWS